MLKFVELTNSMICWMHTFPVN